MIHWADFWQCLQSAGNTLPDDVAIIGANNDPLVCGLTYPMLSSVSIPWDNFGQFVGGSMQRMIDGGSGWKRTLHLIQPSGVIFRHSANHLAVRDKTLRRALSFMTERIKEPITVSIHVTSYGLHGEVWRENLRNPLIARPGKCSARCG